MGLNNSREALALLAASGRQRCRNGVEREPGGLSVAAHCSLLVARCSLLIISYPAEIRIKYGIQNLDRSFRIIATGLICTAYLKLLQSLGAIGCRYLISFEGMLKKAAQAAS